MHSLLRGSFVVTLIIEICNINLQRLCHNNNVRIVFREETNKKFGIQKYCKTHLFRAKYQDIIKWSIGFSFDWYIQRSSNDCNEFLNNLTMALICSEPNYKFTAVLPLCST